MRLREAVFNLIAPYDCLLCQTEGTLVCAWCWPELFEQAPEQCFSCRTDSPAAAVCPRCRVDLPLNHVWVTTPYRGGARALVRRMKIDAQREACALIARAMDEAAPYIDAACVTSVPTSLGRIRERGFDHGRLIAEEFARLRKMPYREIMTRSGRSKQAGANKEERQKQVQGIYKSRHERFFSGSHFLVIDDVTTTGATLGEVARVLRAHGAETIDAIVFAQTIK